MKWENDTFGLVLRMRQMVYSSKDFENLLIKANMQGRTVSTQLLFRHSNI